MSDVALGVIVRPLTALALFFLAAVAAFALRRIIPDSRVKRFLYTRASQFTSWHYLAILITYIALFGTIAVLYSAL